MIPAHGTGEILFPSSRLFPLDRAPSPPGFVAMAGQGVGEEGGQAGVSLETILPGYPWLEEKEILACLVNARQMVASERLGPLPVELAE